MKVFLKVYTASLGVVIDAKWLRFEGDLGVVIKVGETPHNRLFIYEKWEEFNLDVIIWFSYL